MNKQEKSINFFSWINLACISSFALAYFILGKLFINFDPPGIISVVWPGSGLILAIIFIYGKKLWPGILIGAFFFHYTNGFPFFVSLWLASAATLAVVWAKLLLKESAFRQTLERERDVLLLVMVSILSALVYSTASSTILYLGGIVTSENLWKIWSSLWVSDVLGYLILGSFILVWFNRGSLKTVNDFYKEKNMEVVFLALVLVFSNLIVFHDYIVFTGISSILLLYIIFPPLLWAGLRFGPRGATLSVLAVAILAMSGVANGGGSIFGENLPDLFYLQIFIGAISISVMILNAAITENEHRSQKIKKMNSAKDEFLATLAHELRNPLSPIRSSLEAIESGDDLTQEEFKESLAVIKRQTGYMTRLVDDLLDVSRITRGKIVLRKEVIDVRNIVKLALETTSATIKKKNHEVEVKVPDEPVWLETDPIRLEQILINLLNNAASYMESGGKIWITVERGKNINDIVIRVKDKGKGVGRESLPYLFDDSNTVVKSLDRRSTGGLGIGLKLIKTLVTMHSGTIEAHSDGPGKGSEFVVSLPARRKSDRPELPRFAEPVKKEPEVVPAAVSATGSLNKILVVDDNKDAADALSKLLAKRGYEIETVYDGPEAIEAAHKFLPGVILLDIGLPRMSGYDVAREIRKTDRDIVLIAITGYGQDDDKKRCLEAGFNFHLTKPVGIAELKSILDGLVVK